MKNGSVHLPEIRHRTVCLAGQRLRLRDSLAACVEILPRLATLRPGTPLRTLSLIALCALGRTHRIRMTPCQRKAVVSAMELGALLNDRFDGDPCDTDQLRKHSAWFARSPYRNLIRNYVRRLWRLERQRPEPDACLTAVRSYREQVNHLSLATLWALVSDSTLADAELQVTRDQNLNLLFRIVMITQVMDDLFDKEEDRRRGLPSFATAAKSDRAFLHAMISHYAALPTRSDGGRCLRLTSKAVSLCAFVSVSWMPGPAT